MTIEDKIDATAEQIEQSIEFGCLTKEHLRLILKQFTNEAFDLINIHSVSKRTFIVEGKISGTCYWESLSVEFDNLEEAKCFFNRRYEKYSENIRLVEVYAR